MDDTMQVDPADHAFGALLTALCLCSALALLPADSRADVPDPAAVQAGDRGHSGHAHHAHHAHQAHAAGHADHGDHAAHRAMLEQTSYTRTVQEYALPDVALVGSDGRPTSLAAALGEGEGEAVMVNFIFTTCPTICPVQSGTFAGVQRELGPDLDWVRLVSVSIDPEYDTPERLRAYAERFQAGERWRFLTGRPADVVAVQKAFGAYRGNKMNHEPGVLIRPAGSTAWVRLDGLVSASDLAREYRGLAAAGAPAATAVAARP